MFLFNDYWLITITSYNKGILAFLCTCVNLITKLGSLSHNLEERSLSIFRIARLSSHVCDMVEGR